MAISKSVSGLLPVAKKTRRPVEGSHDCSVCISDSTQCDRQRPYCSQCLQKGRKTCPGYSVSLAWNNGIASRGLKAGWVNPATPATRKSHRKIGSSELTAMRSVALPDFASRHKENTPHVGALKTNCLMNPSTNETLSPREIRRESDNSDPDLPHPNILEPSISSPGSVSDLSVDTAGGMPWYPGHQDIPPASKDHPQTGGLSNKRRRTYVNAVSPWQLSPASYGGGSPSSSAQASWQHSPIATNVSQAPYGSESYSAQLQTQPALPSGSSHFADGLNAFGIPVLNPNMEDGTLATTGLLDGVAVQSDLYLSHPANIFTVPHASTMGWQTSNIMSQTHRESWTTYQSSMQHTPMSNPAGPQPTINSSPAIHIPMSPSMAYQLEHRQPPVDAHSTLGNHCSITPSTSPEYPSGISHEAFPPSTTFSLPNRRAPQIAQSRRRTRTISGQTPFAAGQPNPRDQRARYTDHTTTSLGIGQPTTPDQFSPAFEQFPFEQSASPGSTTPMVGQMWQPQLTGVLDEVARKNEHSWSDARQQQQPVEFTGSQILPDPIDIAIENGNAAPLWPDDVNLGESWDSSQFAETNPGFEDSLSDMHHAQWPDEHLDLLQYAQSALTTPVAPREVLHQDAIEMQRVLPPSVSQYDDLIQQGQFEFGDLITSFSTPGQIDDDEVLDVPETTKCLELVPTGISPFARLRSAKASGLPNQLQGKVLHRLLDYYVHNICPWIVVEDVKNPYREYVVAGALQSPVLLHAVAALAVNNIRRRKEHTPGFCGDIPELGSLELADAFHYQRCADLMKTALEDSNTDQTQKAACIMAMTIICLRSICDSAHADFALQTKFFCQALRRADIAKQSSFRMFNASFWCWFDVMASVINCRPSQMLPHGVDWTDLETGLGRMEQFCGCDGRLFKAIAKLGGLIQLSRGKHFASEAEHTTHWATKRAEDRLKGAQGASRSSYPTPPRNPLNRSAHKPSPHASKSHYFFGLSGPADPDDRQEFWTELRAVKKTLQDWTPKEDTPISESPTMQWATMTNSNQAFRYAALLIVSRLEQSPTTKSLDPPIATLVDRGMAAIKELIHTPGPGYNNPQLKFLLWPLFVLGSEAVHEEHRNTIRDLCRDIYLESGFRNNVDVVALLEQMWALAAEREVAGERGGTMEGEMRRMQFEDSMRSVENSAAGEGGFWEYGVPLSWVSCLKRAKVGEWMII